MCRERASHAQALVHDSMTQSQLPHTPLPLDDQAAKITTESGSLTDDILFLLCWRLEGSDNQGLRSFAGRVLCCRHGGRRRGLTLTLM